ncbi:hypothetical protein [Nocardia sp. XZ_19_385]|uniref:hypothetical protein n=1 Tax=Nocardia sp. XZ_19_385 TaxID=2769488 RepID=UPI00188E8E04|nr:hypothetical protein [Nocardia sp. XZ_19_385]
MQKLFLVTAVTAAALSLAACGGDIATAAPAASEAPIPVTTAAPAATVEPTAVIMIDPDGDKWNRARTIREARQLAESVRESGTQLPANFCDQGYIEGIEGGGQFPSGRQAWLDACEEGVRQAS